MTIEHADANPGLPELGGRIRERIAATGADIVVLPIRFDDRTGKNVYSQNDVLIVKRLKAEGIGAVYLDDSDDRVFESLNSSELLIAGTLALGIATNLAYDVLKVVVTRIWRRSGSDAQISVKVTDAADTNPSEWTVTGPPMDVLDTLQQLKDRDLLPADLVIGSPAFSRPTDLPEPSDYVDAAVDERLAAAEELQAEAEALLDQDADRHEQAEKVAVAALAKFRSALDWAEDTTRRDETHGRLDAAGRWKRERFRCQMEYSDGQYWETCPVALGHQRVGLSVGGVAFRACTICGFDFTECEHDPSRTYLVPGGNGVDEHCRVCGARDCEVHKAHLMYDATPMSIITEMLVDEVSMVARPAFKDARIDRASILASELPFIEGHNVPPGTPLICSKCLTDCGGLIEMDGRS